LLLCNFCHGAGQQHISDFGGAVRGQDRPVRHEGRGPGPDQGRHGGGAGGHQAGDDGARETEGTDQRGAGAAGRDAAAAALGAAVAQPAAA